MTSREFYDLVVRMRERQKAYNRLRCSENLNAAKKLEKEVDAEIARVQGIEQRRIDALQGTCSDSGNMEIRKAYCLFEQSGTFKNEFIRLGIPAEDYDIQDKFDQTDHRTDLFAEIERAWGGMPSIIDGIGGKT